ncbi:DUF6942 family protein [Pseudoalteromonas piscicida]|uniref:DUF6942 family protein n=1 Tax=Pseudoalteromonas piscicida TaxID=43662 RepID=UPI003095AF1C
MITVQSKKILTQGLGAKTGRVAFYIEHPPKLEPYQNLTQVTPLAPGEIDHINQHCGNGWRKIFNVFAKFLFTAKLTDHDITNYPTWQAYRDNQLLQHSSQEALLFSAPDFSIKTYDWHIISGRTYAKSLLRDQIFTNNLMWLDDEFAVDYHLHLIISPFLDYRQLSNIKINKLVNIITQR